VGVVDVRGMNPMALLEGFQTAAGELALLQMDGASIAELKSAQRTVDSFMEEIGRRMAW
jgi:hypothetical protein